MQSNDSLDFAFHPIAEEFGNSVATHFPNEPSSTTPPRRFSSKTLWTDSETNALFIGIQKHGVGCWKSILSDETLKQYFHPSRTEVSLKDRYRVVWGSRSSPKPIIKVKTDRRKRRKWTVEEDQEALKWFEVLGAHWTTIAKKSDLLRQNNRSGTDVRDRVRNKYPDLYINAPAVSNRKLSTASAPELPASYYSPTSTPLSRHSSISSDFDSAKRKLNSEHYNFQEKPMNMSASFLLPPVSNFMFSRVSMPAMHVPASASSYASQSSNHSPMNIYDLPDTPLSFYVPEPRFQPTMHLENTSNPALSYNDNYFLPSITESEFDTFQKRLEF
ncbi:hypothetical protein HMI54_000835 [Coelomomyces lativittatus]|nr:hypothetical protein HMI55_000741 [Coelomomyces lativittatus]KAJ1510531.1 hypothetical protein HMI56_006292 [Coelomomyces lativittatus]KAJ1511416.1 hypothetical protein HMI54_000835 [Coelomomyces lativittatus]